MSRPPEQKSIDILLVDDDKGDVLLTKIILKNEKLINRIDDVKDGVEALEYLRKEGEYKDAPRPGLILMDLNMPRMNGHETLAEIKRDESLKTIPVVMLTTSAEASDVKGAYELQANAYVAKPVDLEQLSSVIESITNYWFCVVRLPPNS